MPSAAPAYQYEPDRHSNTRPERAPRVRVVPGSRVSQGISPAAVKGIRIFAVALMVCAVVGCIRVGLLTATVSTLADSENVVSQTTQLRSQSADLQVKESSLSNPTTIKQTASTSLGMSAPEETTKITLGTDVVSVDDSGSLSLSQSLAAASR